MQASRTDRVVAVRAMQHMAVLGSQGRKGDLQLGKQSYNLGVQGQQERSHPQHLRLPIVPEVSLANGRANSATRAGVPGTNSTGGANGEGSFSISVRSLCLALSSHFVDRTVHRSLGKQGCQTSLCSIHLQALPPFPHPNKTKTGRSELPPISNIYITV